MIASCLLDQAVWSVLLGIEYPLSTEIVIVPLEVTGVPEVDKCEPDAVSTPTEVTVPEGSSPEGITIQSAPLDIIVSPTLHIGAVEWSVITLYT